MHCCCLSHPVCATLLRHSEERLTHFRLPIVLTGVQHLACQLVAAFPSIQRHPRDNKVLGIIINSNSRCTVSAVLLQRNGGGVKNWVTQVIFGIEACLTDSLITHLLTSGCASEIVL